MTSKHRVRRLLAAVVLLAGWLRLGAQSPSPAPALPAEERSVRPGINQEYLKTNLAVEPFIERFEKEGREIYDQRHKIVQALGIPPGASVADIGCGTGLFTLLFAEAVGPSGRVFAVDIVKEFLRHIDQRLKQAGVTNVQTVLCTERSVELPPASIDLAFLCDTYHHFEFPRATMASVHRALRPGGELVLIDFQRVPGQSADWVLNHVRAGQAEVEKEIESDGFQKVEERALLKQNYFIRFRKVGK